MNCNNWEIKVNSEKCPYFTKAYTDTIYTCKYPGYNYNKKCDKNVCPISFQSINACDVEKCYWRSVKTR